MILHNVFKLSISVHIFKIAIKCLSGLLSDAKVKEALEVGEGAAK